VKNFIFEKRKWFFEGEVPYDRPDTKIGIKIKKKIYSGHSSFQKIEVYDTFAYGKILVLDDILQLSEKDEFVYHEMICHPPLFIHRNPEKVLVVGGGDGGSLKESLKHSEIKEIYLAEIDEKVINLCRKHMPKVSGGAFKNKKVKIFTEDGKEFINRHNNFFDVIILDLSDPAGPAKELISLNFYRNVKKALKKGGVISIQSGSLSDQARLTRLILERVKKIFSWAEIRKAVVPSYFAGEYSFITASDSNLAKVSFKTIEKKCQKTGFNFKYYSPEIHFASKILPENLKIKLKGLV
jgi:spermidine synthase